MLQSSAILGPCTPKTLSHHLQTFFHFRFTLISRMVLGVGKSLKFFIPVAGNANQGELP